jgi:hypothetical protein
MERRISVEEEESESLSSSDSTVFNDRDEFIEAEKVLPRTKLSPKKQESLDLMDKLK